MALSLTSDKKEEPPQKKGGKDLNHLTIRGAGEGNGKRKPRMTSLRRMNPTVIRGDRRISS